MGKISTLFAHIRSARSGKGIGFVGKNAPAVKPRAAALLVELHGTDAGSAEAAVKAGADGLVFAWKSSAKPEELGKAIQAARAVSDDALVGLRLSGGWEKLERTEVEGLKDQGVNFLLLPLNAPARLLALEVKDLEYVVSIPMREGELYPVFMRNLSAFDNLAAVHLDFGLSSAVGNLSIEDILHYRAVREAVRAPALINLSAVPGEDDAYALLALGIQAVVLNESKEASTTTQQVQKLRELLEVVYHEDAEATKLGLRAGKAGI